MRECAECHKPDRPQLDISTDCTCAAKSPDPLVHDVNCRAVVHEVVRYPVRVGIRDLTFDRKLRDSYTRRGWELMQNGMRYYRVKLLCRNCVTGVEAAAERRRDYERACKAARGQSDQTYSQMIAAQD